MNYKEKSISVPKMNSTNLYATTTNIILRADPQNPNSWQDLYRLIPYLRNSLCCVVCSTLLVEPYTPSNAQCQHHVCRACRGGRKRIKPACESCKDCKNYVQNKRLRILMQCYKQMCVTLMNMQIFEVIKSQTSQPGTGFERGASNLIALIKEGAAFRDNYKNKGGLPKSAYSILPCVYTNLNTSSSTVTQTIQPQSNSRENRNVILDSYTPSRTSFYSVVYPGTGNKITLKRKPKETITSANTTVPILNNRTKIAEKSIFKKPCTVKLKKGCRCGNATATPGKLTCCGQRCPCYVESKPCSECRCRGCRNPHRLDGQKVVPRILDIQKIQIVTTPSQSIPSSVSSQPQIPQPAISQSQISPPQITQAQLAPSLTIPSQVSEMASVEYGTIELDTHFRTTHEPVDINQHYNAFKVVSSFDPSLTATDLLSVGYSQGVPDDQISVL